MTDFHFAQPLWLVAGGVLVALLVVAYRFIDRRNRADLKRFVDGKILVQLMAGVSTPLRWTKRALLLAGILSLSAALARPQLGYEWREVKRKGIDILFALDASRSMLAEDVAPNRLERAKLGMLDFVEKLQGDRVGLLPFSGSGFLLCPLTLDYEAFRQSLDAVDTKLIPRKGTDLASAIREASRAFEEAGNNHRILVIITDGEDLQGEALAAAKAAAKDGMVIHTVGIGSPEGGLIPVRTANGAIEQLRDQAGELVRSKLDEPSLRALAEATGGIYAPFGQHAEGLRQIYQEKLSLVPREELSQRMQKVPIERFQWPLSAGILFILLEFVMVDRRRGRQRVKAGALLSHPAPVRGATAALAVAMMAGALLILSPAAQAADARLLYNDGIGAYQSGNLDQANASFQSAIENTTDLGLQARGYYNLGNALFKTGAASLANGNSKDVMEQWEKSLVAYESALALDPGDADAQFNRDLVQRKLEELKKQQEQDQQNKDQQNKDQQEKEGQSAAKEANPDEEDRNPSQPQAKSAAPAPEDKENSKEAGADQVAVDQERRNPGEMSPEEAKQLLRALENDEERLLLVPSDRGNPRDPDNTTKGKDW